MFALSSDELNQNILGCADGPASVNAELHEQGKHYVSVDPIYRFSARQIEERITATVPVIMKQLEENTSDYRWDYYQTPDQLLGIRQTAMRRFLQDYDQAGTGRYIDGALPKLPFTDRSFDLVVCSYCLFTYSDQLTEEFHKQAILEMCRIGKEVRIFPLLTMSGQRSPYLPGVLRFLAEKSIDTDTIAVDYEFQKGGNQLLRLARL